MTCNCRGGPTCCIRNALRDANLCYGFGYEDDTDVYYRPPVDDRKAREALNAARAKRKKNIKSRGRVDERLGLNLQV